MTTAEQKKMKSILEIIKVIFIIILLFSFMITLYSYGSYKKQYAGAIWMYDNGLAEKIEGVNTVKEMYSYHLRSYPNIIGDFAFISYLNLLVFLLGLIYIIFKKWLERNEKNKSGIK